MHSPASYNQLVIWKYHLSLLSNISSSHTVAWGRVEHTVRGNCDAVTHHKKLSKNVNILIFKKRRCECFCHPSTNKGEKKEAGIKLMGRKLNLDCT